MTVWKKTLLSAAGGGEAGYYIVEYTPSSQPNIAFMRSLTNSAIGYANGIPIGESTGAYNWASQAWGFGVTFNEDGTLKHQTKITTSRAGSTTGSKPVRQAALKTDGNTVYITTESGTYNVFFSTDSSGNEDDVFEGFIGIHEFSDFAYVMDDNEMVFYNGSGGAIQNFDLDDIAEQVYGWKSTISPNQDGSGWRILSTGMSTAYNNGSDYVVVADCANTNGSHFSTALLRFTSASNQGVPNGASWGKRLTGKSIGASSQSSNACLDSSGNTYAIHASKGSAATHSGVYLVKYNSSGTEQYNGRIKFDWSNYYDYGVTEGQLFGCDVDENGNIIYAMYGALESDSSTNGDYNTVYIFSLDCSGSSPSCNWAWRLTVDSTVTGSNNYIWSSNGFGMDRTAEVHYITGTIRDLSSTFSTSAVQFLLRLPNDGTVTAGQYGDLGLEFTDVTSNFTFNSSDGMNTYSYPSSGSLSVSTGFNNGLTDKTSSYACSSASGGTFTTNTIS